MLQIVYKNEAGEKVVHPLEDGGTFTVGRGANAEIRIRNSSISRAHAKIFQRGGGWMVEDLGSSNSTFVNGEKISRSAFAGGDVVRFGDFSVRVVEEGGGRRSRRSRPSDDEGEGSARRRSSRDEEAPRQRRSRGSESEAPSRRARAAEDEEKPRRSRRAAAAEEEEKPRRSRRTRAGADAEEDASTSRSSRRSRSAADEGKGRARRGRDAEPEPEPEKKKQPPRREAPAKRSAPAGIDPAKLREAEARVGELEEQLKDAKRQHEAQAQRIKELESREARLEDEQREQSERYDRVRQQLDHNQELLQRAKDDNVEHEETIEAFEREVVALESQLGQVEAAKEADAELLSDLKSRVVHKDRRIDELQRELDMMEYDLRNTREELESIQDSMNHENTETRKLTRDLSLLREVIQEKENHVKELKIEIEEQGREIYDLKMGTGVQDLEEAKHDVLEKYFEANRENEELREKLRAAERRAEAATNELDEVEERLAESRDIEAHPDFQRKQRELERAQTDLEEVREEAARLNEKLEHFGPDAKAKLDAELNFVNRKNQALQEKLDQLAAEGESSAEINAELGFARKKNEALEEKVEELRNEVDSLKKAAKAAAAVPAGTTTESTGKVSSDTVVRAQASEAVDELLELYSSWKSNLTLLRSYADDASEAADDGSNVAEQVSSLTDTLTVLESDASGMRRELKSLKSMLTPEG